MRAIIIIACLLAVSFSIWLFFAILVEDEIMMTQDELDVFVNELLEEDDES